MVGPVAEAQDDVEGVVPTPVSLRSFQWRGKIMRRQDAPKTDCFWLQQCLCHLLFFWQPDDTCTSHQTQLPGQHVVWSYVPAATVPRLR